MATLVGLGQNFLKEQLVKTNESAGMVLEVKEMTGLGTVLDCIIYDGTLHKNDFLVIGGTTKQIAKIKSLLMPEPLRDIRTEKKFRILPQDLLNKGANSVRNNRCNAPNTQCFQSRNRAVCFCNFPSYVTNKYKCSDVKNVEIKNSFPFQVLSAALTT